MKANIKYFLIPLLAIVLLAASGCSAPETAGLTEAEVTGITENMLKSLDANNQETFSQDFSDDMRAAFKSDQITGLQSMLQTASGKFVSLGKPTLTNNQGYAIYRFPAKYEQETVYVTVTFLVGGKQVEGLFFDSVNLREVPK
jgi:hypothetical protein